MMAKDNFQPQTAFEGYIKAKLEGIEDRLDKLPCGESFKRLNKCETSIADIKGRTTVFSSILGFCAGMISKLIFNK